MSAQFLEYIRQEIITATADLSGATKGQMMAWLEHAQYDTDRYKRKKMRVRDEVTGKIISLDNPPVPGKQSHAKGSHIPLVQPVEFSTASWRRAVMVLEEHQRAWLLWSYSGNIRWEHQETITCWAWAEFRAKLGTRKIAGKTRERLKALIWLAAQDVRKGIHGEEQYTGVRMAELTGMDEKNWYKTFGGHWDAIKAIFTALDGDALYTLTRSRSQQKAANYNQTIAKVE
ncbi:antiterminator [Izhakiella australiensis]|uniref:Antiterminator n=1 Tax=Izhakiella australiensis TaxID=1926881 RepID=A0A1S8YLK6_9GAMM|nr:bacteriophage antitermination protein Q [Izhakiella australiensis]OON39656.1 antiterminator [Izhakiella australiensis]